MTTLMLAMAVTFTAALGSASAASFVGGPLPAAPGLGLSRNHDYEPDIAAAPDGQLWIASSVAFDPRSGTGGVVPYEEDPLAAGLSGTDIWRSTDGGRTYRWVAAPFNPLRGHVGLSEADSDISVATRRNAQGFYNVYAVGLWAPAGVGSAIVSEVSLAVSRDGGRTWVSDFLSAAVPFDDRPWVVADGACGLYLAYHGLPTATNFVQRYDLCHLASDVSGLTLMPVSSSRLVMLAPAAATNASAVYVTASIGKLRADSSSTSPYRGSLYLPAMDCRGLRLSDEVTRAVASAPSNCPAGTDAEVYVLRSRDAGRRWSLVPVTATSGSTVPLWSVWAAVASTGTVYLFWTDAHSIYLDVSRDGGAHWTAPRRIATSPSLTGIEPTADASGPDTVEVAWYGAPVAGFPEDARTFGTAGDPHAVPWRVFWARSTDGGSSFEQFAATGPVHTGAACVSGDACGFGGSLRDLFEDFGLAISPTTGRASITYTSDQPQGDLLHDYTGYATEAP